LIKKGGYLQNNKEIATRTVWKCYYDTIKGFCTLKKQSSM